MGLLRRLFITTRNFLIFFLTFALLPGLPPKTHFPINSISYEPMRPFTGPLQPNGLLNDAERLLGSAVVGPECLRYHKENVYLSQEGSILRTNGVEFWPVVRFGKSCEPHQPEVCGRPLGFDFDTISNSLIAADAYLGIWSLDLKSMRKTQLISPEDVLPGVVPRPAKTFNSLAIARNGDIYWTDSSSDFNLLDGVFAFLANPSGRLFHYDRQTRKSRVLADRLHFANGVLLSPDESFVVVAESAASQLRRVFLRGPRAGESEVFTAGLPGVPDNLSGDERGIWVPLVSTFDEHVPTALWQSAGRAPLVRAFALHMLVMAQIPLQLIDRVVPNFYVRTMLNYLGSFKMGELAMPTRTQIIRVDWNGEVISSLDGTDGTTANIAHVLEHDGDLWLGSYSTDFLARVPVPKNFKRGDLFVSSLDKPTTTTTTTTTPKPTTTTTPKPTTTTTPKPTTTTTTTPKPTTTTTPKPTTTPKAQPTTTTTTTTTTRKPATTTTTQKPVPTTTTTTTTPKPEPTTTPKPAAAPTTTAKPAARKPAAAATAPAGGVPPPPPPPQPTEPEAERVVPAQPQPIEEQHDEPTRPPPPAKMKVIKRGGEHVEL